MGGHNATFNRYSLEKGLYDLYAFVLVTGTTPALQQRTLGGSAGPGGALSSGTFSAAPSSGWKGFLSVSRQGTGAWQFVLDAPWVDCLEVNPTPVVTTALLTAAAPVCILNRSLTNVRNTAKPIVAVQWQSSGGSAADPASGELLVVHVTVQNSTAT